MAGSAGVAAAGSIAPTAALALAVSIASTVSVAGARVAAAGDGTGGFGGCPEETDGRCTDRDLLCGGRDGLSLASVVCRGAERQFDVVDVAITADVRLRSGAPVE